MHNTSTRAPGRCATCVLPTTTGLITFEDGVCSICRATTPSPDTDADARARRLEEEVERMRTEGRNRPYDCVVGLSGGRDSTYLLYLLVRRHGLRCLAAYYRTPFTPDEIDGNVRRATARLGVPLAELEPLTRDRHLRIARHYFRLWLERPDPAIANLACPCKLVNRELFLVAQAHGARAVVSGENRYENVQFLPAFQGADDTEARFSGRNQTAKALRLLGKGAKLLASRPAVARHLPTHFRTALLYFGPGSTWLRVRYPAIRNVEYFYLAPWTEADCVGTIRSELDWEVPAGSVTSWRADCDFADLKNYMFRRTAGATYTEALLSNLVRAGQLTREEALRRLEERPVLSWPRLQRALETMGLPADTIRPD